MNAKEHRELGNECLKGNDITYSSYISEWTSEDTTEDPLFIAKMRVDNKDKSDFIIYLERILESNEIGY